MKKFTEIFEKLFFWVCFIVLPGVVLIQTFFSVSQHYDSDPRKAELIPGHAPEGTAYIDILAEISEEDANYLAFQSPVYWYIRPEELQPLPISGGSEIAQYEEEGYRSLSLHTDSVYRIIVYDSEKNQTSGWNSPEVLILNAPDTIEQMAQRYGSFKAAYVDENGRILKVTDSFEIQYEDKLENAFLSDDSQLTLRISETSPEKMEFRKKLSVIRIIILISSLLTGFFYLWLSSLRRKKYELPPPNRHPDDPEAE